jgi:hypothetical protein
MTTPRFRRLTGRHANRLSSPFCARVSPRAPRRTISTCQRANATIARRIRWYRPRARPYWLVSPRPCASVPYRAAGVFPSHVMVSYAAIRAHAFVARPSPASGWNRLVQSLD